MQEPSKSSQKKKKENTETEESKIQNSWHEKRKDFASDAVSKTFHEQMGEQDNEFDKLSKTENFKDFMKLYKYYTKGPLSILENKAILLSDNPLGFRKNLL